MLSVVMVSVMAVAPYIGVIIVIYDCDHSGLYYKFVTIVAYTSCSLAKSAFYDRNCYTFSNVIYNRKTFKVRAIVFDLKIFFPYDFCTRDILPIAFVIKTI